MAVRGFWGLGSRVKGLPTCDPKPYQNPQNGRFLDPHLCITCTYTHLRNPSLRSRKPNPRAAPKPSAGHYSVKVCLRGPIRVISSSFSMLYSHIEVLHEFRRF